MDKLARRQFFKNLIATVGVAGIAGRGSRSIAAPTPVPAYDGPRVIIVRYGGGVRRRETIDADHSYAPYLASELLKRGTLFSDMRISTMEGLNTSHGEGTLNILTGRYDRYESVDRAFLSERFEAKVPTLFEYLRKAYAVPDHQTLIVNGEDRTQEEFYSFSNHHLFGAAFRSNVLSLYRYKTHVLRSQVAAGKYSGSELMARRRELEKMERLDLRGGAESIGQGAEIEAYWERWRELYGDTGLKNPRGDRLLTELAARAIQQLRPLLMMINYNDPDYVHWGNLSHYTRGITIIDEGVRRLMDVVNADEEYRGNTIFALVPDCGRDTSPFASVPCQHHFNSVSSRRIWALFVGPGIPEGEVDDREVQQIDFAPTIAKLMGCPAEHADGSVLEAAIA